MALPTIASYELPAPGSWPVSRASWALEPSRAALLVHDMQAYFLRPFDPESAPLRPMLEHLRALRAACARAGVPILFSVQPGEQSRVERGLLWDLWGPGIIEHPSLAPLGLEPGIGPRDVLIAKRRYSAFFETGMDERLRELGRDQLLITGVYAHIGCLATALDGFMRGIQPFFVADATGDFSREDHDIALRQVARTSGVVISTRYALDALSLATLREALGAGGSALDLDADLEMRLTPELRARALEAIRAPSSASPERWTLRALLELARDCATSARPEDRWKS